MACPTCLTSTCALRALRAYALYVPKYILQIGKLKMSVLMKSNERSFTDVFEGAEF